MKPEKVIVSLRKIHETAVVHPGSRIGKDVEIGPYAVIGENVVIGDNTKIGAHVVLDGWTSIGKNCVIFPSASIGSEPQDLKFCGEKSYVFIGDNTKYILLAHLSEENNTEDIAYDTLIEKLKNDNIYIPDIIITKQDKETELIKLW